MAPLNGNISGKAHVIFIYIWSTYFNPITRTPIVVNNPEDTITRIERRQGRGRIWWKMAINFSYPVPSLRRRNDAEEEKKILTVVRFIFPSEKPVAAHQRRRDKSVDCQQGCCRGASKDGHFLLCVTSTMTATRVTVSGLKIQDTRNACESAVILLFLVIACQVASNIQDFIVLKCVRF